MPKSITIIIIGALACANIFIILVFVNLQGKRDILQPLTNAEINACAVMVAIQDYRSGFDWSTEKKIPNERSEEDAIQALLVDSGPNPDFIATSAAYKRSIGLDTVYTRYVQDGTKLCLAKKMRGEEIVMPELKVRAGYHVTRWNGSAALVKDGDLEPVFGCMDGYHPTGTGCAKN